MTQTQAQYRQALRDAGAIDGEARATNPACKWGRAYHNNMCVFDYSHMLGSATLTVSYLFDGLLRISEKETQ